MINILKKINEKRNNLINAYSSKYVVNYEIVDGNLKINSCNGKSRTVKNSKANIKKINKIIVESKVAIAKKIDEYQSTFMDRLSVLAFCMLLIIALGFVSIFSFFIGSMVLFIFSIFAFSCSVIFSSYIGITYYLTMLDIRKLKRVTGYKNDLEFQSLKLYVKALKK